jgi:hypothetical protein
MIPRLQHLEPVILRSYTLSSFAPIPCHPSPQAEDLLSFSEGAQGFSPAKSTAKRRGFSPSPSFHKLLYLVIPRRRRRTCFRFSEGAQGFSPAKSTAKRRSFSPGPSFHKPQLLSFSTLPRPPKNARQLPIHSQPLDTHDKMDPDTNSPAQAGLNYLTHHENQTKSKPKVSAS